MPDIFISYSRKDSEHALMLVEKLRASGIDVWIDKQSIEGAAMWSEEIVEAIEQCKAFILLLSKDSAGSKNVVREVSLASDKERTILPLALEEFELPNSLKYPLAGVQRLNFSDYDAIIRSLVKLGITTPAVIASEAKQSRSSGIDKSGEIASSKPPRNDKPGDRKSLMILPFEDLSPTQDNGWFADGLMSEMISSLSHVKALRLIDQKTSMDYKGYRGKTWEIARDLNVRYFIEGSVRKFGEQIKITVQLLDIEEGEYLWTDSHRGEFKDIFDIQEEVARKVVDGLKLTLTKEEEKKVLDRGTENAEAYELLLKASEYYDRITKEGYRHAISLLSEAIRLDPGYAEAHRFKALVLALLYRSYDRTPSYLMEAEKLARTALTLKPDLWSAYESLSNIYRLQGKQHEAEEVVLEYVRHAPEDAKSHFSLGSFYSVTNQPQKAIAAYEEAIRLKPDDLTTYWNLVVDSDRAGDRERVMRWSEAALPYCERRLRLQPDDENTRVQYASLLLFADRGEEAISALMPLENVKDLDANSLYNIACLYSHLEEYPKALAMLKRAVEAGFASIETFRTDPDLEPLREMPEFQELMREVEEKQASSAQ